MVMPNAKVACYTALRAGEQRRESSLSERRYGEPGTPDISSEAVGKVLHRLLVIRHHFSDGETMFKAGIVRAQSGLKTNIPYLRYCRIG